MWEYADMTNLHIEEPEDCDHKFLVNFDKRTCDCQRCGYGFLFGAEHVHYDEDEGKFARGKVIKGNLVAKF